VIGRAHEWPVTSKSDLNTALLAAELLLIVCYRQKNWSQQIKLRNDSGAHDQSRKQQFIAALDPQIANPAVSEEDLLQLDILHDAAARLSDGTLAELIARLVEL
jgi:hypothetical protein